MPREGRHHRYDAHIFGDGPATQARQDRGAESGADERQLRRILERRVLHARLTSLGTQRHHQPVVADRAALPGNPRITGEFAERDGVARGERVLATERDIRNVVEHRCSGEAVWYGKRLIGPVLREREIDVAAHEQANRVERLQFLQAHLELRMFLHQRAHGPRCQAADRRGERPNPQLARHSGAPCVELRLGLAKNRERPLGVSRQHLPRVGERDTASAFLEQRFTDLAFQLRDLLGDGRRRDVQRIGGGVQRIDDVSQFALFTLDLARFGCRGDRTHFSLTIWIFHGASFLPGWRGAG